MGSFIVMNGVAWRFKGCGVASCEGGAIEVEALELR